MLGTIISADMDLIGQLQPHQPAHFVKVDIETALKARAAEKSRIDRLRRSLA
jgi:allophanate hydrolase subunit 2